ncbi:hypothetical protein Acr_18g0011780 [Actinidia rufa]|uniref:Uncharacterized protein n=1 Tax=Actinidia rufa TaxID=165716 RepID=A0A7J0G8H8_9ERIC|nr:hypothetical protein Acr_18g0011780 [Actinidia rufa]
MPSHQARGRARSLTGARGAYAAHRARGNRDEGDNDKGDRQSRQGGYSRGLAQEQLQVRKTTYLFSLWSSWSQSATMHTKEEHSGRFGSERSEEAYAVTPAVGPLETVGQQEQ